MYSLRFVWRQPEFVFYGALTSVSAPFLISKIYEKRDFMLRRYGLWWIVTGLIILILGIVALYLGLFSNLSLISIIKATPWIFIIIGTIIILTGLFFLIKSTTRMSSMLEVKVVEKKLFTVVFEFDDGSRKKFINMSNYILVPGDIGTISYKGKFLTVFNRRIYITKKGN